MKTMSCPGFPPKLSNLSQNVSSASEHFDFIENGIATGSICLRVIGRLVVITKGSTKEAPPCNG